MDKSQVKVATPAVKAKVVYVKFLHLADKERGKPVFYRRLRGFPKPVPVYDLALYCVYQIFNERRNSFYEWRFQSSEGQIDNVTQLHPFAGPTHDSYPVGNPGSWTHRIHGYCYPPLNNPVTKKRYSIRLRFFC